MPPAIAELSREEMARRLVVIAPTRILSLKEEIEARGCEICHKRILASKGWNRQAATREQLRSAHLLCGDKSCRSKYLYDHRHEPNLKIFTLASTIDMIEEREQRRSRVIATNVDAVLRKLRTRPHKKVERVPNQRHRSMAERASMKGKTLGGPTDGRKGGNKKNKAKAH